MDGGDGDGDAGSGGSPDVLGDGDGDTPGDGDGDEGTGGAASGSGGAGAVSDPRPQLTDEEAEEHTVLNYLATKGSVTNPTQDDWDPTAGLGDIAEWTPDFTVAESSGTHTTVQAAIEAALAVGGTDRIFIAVEPGTYRELVCVNVANPPLTLYGTGTGPEETRIVFDNYAGKPKGLDEPGHPCSPNLGREDYGTSGSTTVHVQQNGFNAKNLTFENDTDEAGKTGALQAVALLTVGDQIVLEDVRLLGNQDTFYVKAVNPALVVRVYVRDSYIAGDTDFVFGNARLVLEGTELHVVGNRKTDGVLFAPSTHALGAYGFLLAGGTVTADENVTAARLGRAWDEGQGDLASYLENVATGDYPNGAAVIRETELTEKVPAAAWAAAATTGRPFSSVATTAPANRLYEYENTGPGSVSGN